MIGALVSGMDFALNKTLVDAMIGHPYVVTMGVREQVVKPATKFAGSFAMNCITHLPIERTPALALRPSRRIFPAVILAIGLV